MVEQLEKGIINIITSHTILDEGINIPSVDSAFITYAAREPRQGIQRRGRVLRLSDSKNYAQIYDLICRIDKNFVNQVSDKDKNAAVKFIEWLNSKEKERKDEFTKSSMELIEY